MQPSHCSNTLPTYTLHRVCMLQVSMGVTLEQARELRAPYAAYCARLEQLGAESAAALATVQEVQQASWGQESTCWLCWPAAGHQCCLLPPCLLQHFLRLSNRSHF